MDFFIFLSVLLAAFFHALWNSLVKSSPNKLLGMTAVCLGGIPPALILLLFVPLPDKASLIWLFFSVFCHMAYQISLIFSYRLGDYTSVYPIARGSAPVWVTLATIFFLPVELTTNEIYAIVLICFGIFILAFTKQQDGHHSPKAIAAALLTGFFIASYSLLDGLGARAANTALGYLVWVMILDGLVFGFGVYCYDKTLLKKTFTHEWRTFLLGGFASTTAYGIVIWAMFLAPIALVVALREISVMFALCIGVLFLREKVTMVRIISVLLSLCGVVLLRLA